MTDNLDAAVTAAYVRRHNAGAAQRDADLGDARNHALDVGPGPDAVTMSSLLRDARPDRPRLTAALSQLVTETYKTMRGTRATAAPPRRTPAARAAATVTPPSRSSLTHADMRAGLPCRRHLVRNCVTCRP